MTHHTDLQAVRQIVRNWLRARFASFSPDELSESILLQGAKMVGQQFQCRNMQARWFALDQRIDILLNERLVQSIDVGRSSEKDVAA